MPGYRNEKMRDFTPNSHAVNSSGIHRTARDSDGDVLTIRQYWSCCRHVRSPRCA